MWVILLRILDISLNQIVNTQCLTVMPQIGEDNAVSIFVNISSVMCVGKNGLCQNGMKLAIDSIFPSILERFAVYTLKQLYFPVFLVCAATEIISGGALGYLIATLIIKEPDIKGMSARKFWSCWKNMRCAAVSTDTCMEAATNLPWKASGTVLISGSYLQTI